MRTDVQQAAVLTAIAARLRSALTLAANQCYLSALPLHPKMLRGGPWFLAVSPGTGSFVEGEQAIGNCTEETTVTITMYSRIAVDRADEDDKSLTDTSRGLLAIKQKVLTALVGHDLVAAAGNTFVRQLLFCRRCGPPVLLEESGAPNNIVAAMQLDFGVMFDWDLA